MKLKGEVKNAGLKLLRRDSNKIGINWICTVILPIATGNKITSRSILMSENNSSKLAASKLKS